MKNRFFIIQKKEEEINEIKNKIRITFDESILEFFRDKGFDFVLKDNVYNPLHVYELHKYDSTHFKKIKNQVLVPRYHIDPWGFRVQFFWHLQCNIHSTQIYWDPSEISLDDFYEKKLKRIFKLL